MSKHNRKWLLRIAMVILVGSMCLLLLLLGEVLVRAQRRGVLDAQIAEIEQFVQQPQEPPQPLTDGRIIEEIVRSNATYGVQQFAEGYSNKHVYRPYVEFRLTPGLDLGGLKINSLGYRGDEFEIRKPADVFRILVYGGSFIWGSGANNTSQTVPAQLQRLVNQHATDRRRFEVINCANPNYGTSQELIYLAMEGVLLSPDLVIFVDGVNDTAWGYSNLPAGYHGDFHQFNRLIQKQPLKSIYTVHELDHLKRERLALNELSGSLLLRRLRRLFDPSRRYDIWLMNHDVPLRDDVPQHLELVREFRRPEEYAWRHLHNIRCVRALAAEYAFQSIFFVQPVPIIGKPLDLREQAALQRARRGNRWVNTELAYWADHYDTYVDKLASECAKRDYPLVDLRFVFRNNDRPLYVDDCHLNGEGYSIVAERILRELQKRGLLQ